MKEKNRFQKFLDKVLETIKKILERVTKWFYDCKDKAAKSKLGQCVTKIKNHFSKAKNAKTQEEANIILLETKKEAETAKVVYQKMKVEYVNGQVVVDAPQYKEYAAEAFIAWCNNMLIHCSIA